MDRSEFAMAGIALSLMGAAYAPRYRLARYILFVSLIGIVALTLARLIWDIQYPHQR
jgi:ammonia channel protein AmtB